MSNPTHEPAISGQAKAETAVSLERHVRRVCDDFSQSWHSGRNPIIEDYITRVPADIRQRALAQLICTELELRWTVGTRSRIEEYYARFPGDREVVAAAFVAASDFTVSAPAGKGPGESQEDSWPLSTETPGARAAGSLVDTTNATPVCQAESRARDAGVGPRIPVAAEPIAHRSKPTALPGYELLERLGQGGMGTVWKARQMSTNRLVALKLVRRLETASAITRERFRREVQLAASLQHPHITRVYDSGLDRGEFFYAMELIEGVPLDEYVAARRATPIEIAQLMATICDALDYAHKHGIVHRDLKPSNLMVSVTGEVSVVDFGLAMSLGENDSQITACGELVGTPAYMSPEQAGGFAHDVDVRSDVFSLGVVLYKLLTGHVPFRGTRDAVINQVLHDTPVLPNRLHAGIPPDLEAICLKAMHKEPSRRYASCSQLADDLRRFLAGDLVSARRCTALHSVVRFCEHPNRIRDAGILTVGLVGVFVLWHLAVAALAWAPFWAARSKAATLVPLIGFYIIAGDVPYILLGLQILHRRRAAIFAILVLDSILAFLSGLFVFFPTTFPLTDAHASPHHVQTNWFFIGAFVLFMTASHVVALIAFVSNRQLIEWQRSAARSNATN